MLIALYENATPFAFRMLGLSDDAADTFRSLWPLQKMPVLTEAGRTVVESSTIIEYLALHHPGPVRLLPADARDAL